MSDLVLVRVAVPSRELGDLISKTLIDAELAASVHLLGPRETRYRWKGEIHEAREYCCEIRTRTCLLPALTQMVHGMHPFEVPEVFYTPISSGSQAYEQWLRDHTPSRPKGDTP